MNPSPHTGITCATLLTLALGGCSAAASKNGALSGSTSHAIATNSATATEASAGSLNAAFTLKETTFTKTNQLVLTFTSPAGIDTAKVGATQSATCDDATWSDPLPLSAKAQVSLAVSLAQAKNQICAKVFDKAGNGSAPSQVALIYDETPPVAVVDAITGALGLTTIKAGKQSFSGKATDAVSGIALVEFSLGSTATGKFFDPATGGFTAAAALWQPATGTTAWVASVPASGFVDGMYALTARATDNAGNVQTTLPSVPFSWLGSLPTLRVGGAPASLSNATSVSLQVSGTRIAQFRYSLAPGAGPCGAHVTGTWNLITKTVNATLGADGPFVACFEGQDLAGNLSPVVTVSWTKVTAAPTLAVTSPANMGYVNASVATAFLVSGTCSANGQQVHVNGSIPGTISATAACTGGIWSTMLDFSFVSDGTVTLSFDLTDAAGNVATEIHASYIKLATLPPAVTITSAAGVNARAVLVQLTFPGTTSQITAVTLRRAPGAAAPADCSSGTLVTSLSTFVTQAYYDIVATPGGAYSYRICTYDAAGNLAKQTASTVITNVAAGTWWDLNFQYRVKVAFHNSARSTALADFPVLLTLTPDWVDYAAMQSQGQDIRFVDADDATPLPYEISAWNAGGSSTVWVRVPSLAPATEAGYIWLYFSNPSATDQQSAASVWSANYVGVWHLGASLNDSTGSGNNGSGTSAVVPGKVDSGRGFDGSTTTIALAAPAVLAQADPLTLSAWVNQTSLTQVSASGNQGGTIFNGFYPASGYILGIRSDGRVWWWPAAGRDVYGSAVIPSSVWTHVVLTSNAGVVRIYVNGVQDAASFAAATAAVPTAMSFGSNSWTTGAFAGALDELSVSNAARSADWVGAQYDSERGFLQNPSGEEASTAIPPLGAVAGQAGISAGNILLSVVFPTGTWAYDHVAIFRSTGAVPPQTCAATGGAVQVGGVITTYPVTFNVTDSTGTPGGLFSYRFCAFGSGGISISRTVLSVTAD